jgi:hypothetical protein
LEKGGLVLVLLGVTGMKRVAFSLLVTSWFAFSNVARAAPPSSKQGERVLATIIAKRVPSLTGVPIQRQVLGTNTEKALASGVLLFRKEGRLHAWMRNPAGKPANILKRVDPVLFRQDDTVPAEVEIWSTPVFEYVLTLSRAHWMLVGRGNVESIEVDDSGLPILRPRTLLGLDPVFQTGPTDSDLHRSPGQRDALRRMRALFD